MTIPDIKMPIPDIKMQIPNTQQIYYDDIGKYIKFKSYFKIMKLYRIYYEKNLLYVNCNKKIEIYNFDYDLFINSINNDYAFEYNAVIYLINYTKYNEIILK
jgi:hypothetical protein